ncbi:hypothetical protein COB72_08045 [bacterium]|nr:MAG: hypothetical protein COB72_08045 [bacterium]
MGIRGPQHTALARVETPISESGGAECGALLDDSLSMPDSEPVLDELIRVWPTLNEWTRRQIRELIEKQIQPE